MQGQGVWERPLGRPVKLQRILNSVSRIQKDEAGKCFKETPLAARN
jgi:hypothetical protein